MGGMNSGRRVNTGRPWYHWVLLVPSPLPEQVSACWNARVDRLSLEHRHAMCPGEYG
jgi:hypothetical protein